MVTLMPSPSKARFPLKLLLVALGFALFLGSSFEAANQGPYTRWFNHRMLSRAVAARLIGRPEADVERLLGGASTRRSDAPSALATSSALHAYDYYPYPWAPVSKFEVQCRNGVVDQVVELAD